MAAVEPAETARVSPPEAEAEPAARRASYAEVGERLPAAVKIAYGAPNLAGAGMAIPIGLYMNIFYSDVVLVPLGYIAIAVAVARSFDAITDPLMGWISDRTNTRFGRRIPWMFVGAPLCATAFYLLFTPPEGLAGNTAALWLAVTFALYFIFHTVYAIPHYGLGPELTQDYNERSSLFAWMEGFTLLGTMLGSALPALVLIPLLGDRDAYTAFALLFGGLLTLLYFWQCYRVKERPDFYQREPNPLVPGVRRVMRNRPFRILLASYFVGSITGAIPGLMMAYFTTYVLRPENPWTWIGVYLLSYFAAGLVTLPLWLRAVRRWGKKPIYIGTGLMGALASLSLFFVGEGQVWMTLAILVWSGTAFGVRIFLGPSIQGDVIDYDELYTGKRREAQYGALWFVIVKFTVIPSASLPLAFLAWAGYVPNVDQTEEVKFAISAIFSLLPMTFGLLSLAFFAFFPINEQTHIAVLEGIEKHKRGESAVDPLTGRTLPPPTDRGVDEDIGWFLDHFSARELERSRREGPAALVRSSLLACMLAIAVGALALAYVITQLSDVSQPQGPLIVFAVVLAGLGLTALLYHLIRLRAAFRMRAAPVPEAMVDAHLEVTRVFTPSSTR